LISFDRGGGRQTGASGEHQMKIDQLETTWRLLDRVLAASSGSG
jgi:hypothetical protein